jgi:predicted dehydrogenase
MMRALGDNIDVLSVLTPSGVHCTNVLEFVEYGRPLVVEKPLALRLEDADRMIEACDAHDVQLFVVHQNRYNPPIVKAHEALEQGRFGKLVLGTVRLRWMRDQAYYDSEAWRGTWAYDGGVFMNQAVHHIDMLSWFMGTPESVRSMAATRLVQIEAEDTGVAIIRYDSGALGVLEATTGARPKDLEGSISILGEKGSVVIGGFFMNDLVEWNFEDKQPSDDVVFEKYGKNPKDFGYNLGEYLRGVIAALQTRKAALVDGLEGRKSLELITALYESIETDSDVQIRFKPKRCRLGVAP